MTERTPKAWREWMYESSKDPLARVLAESRTKGCEDPHLVVADLRDPAGVQVATLVHCALQWADDAPVEPPADVLRRLKEEARLTTVDRLAGGDVDHRDYRDGIPSFGDEARTALHELDCLGVIP
jgi:hypothetical protein